MEGRAGSGRSLLSRILSGTPFPLPHVLVPVIHHLTGFHPLLPQAPRPKAKSFKREQASHEPLEMLACDRQSKAGHMLLNLSRDVEQLLKDVVEAFGNRSGPGHLFDQLFGAQTQEQLSFICNDDINVLSVHAPKAADLAKWDSGECQIGAPVSVCWVCCRC